MPIDLSSVTVEDLDATLYDLCEKFPDMVNPTLLLRCSYRTGDCGCLIGMVLTERWGIPYSPGWETRTASAVLDELGFSAEVQAQARVWQFRADFGREGPQPWGDVAKMMKAGT